MVAAGLTQSDRQAPSSGDQGEGMLKHLATLTIISLALFSSKGAYAYHAWVDAKLDLATPIYWDTSDNVEGLASDVMSGSYGVSVFSGYADMNHVELYAYSGGQMETYAEIEDTYTFTDSSNPSASGTIPGLYLDIHYSGTMTTREPFSDPHFKISVPPHGVTVRPGDPMSGTLSVPILAQYGVPKIITINFQAFAHYSCEVDFSNTASWTFRTTDPEIALAVSSDGGYSPYSTGLPTLSPWSQLALMAGLLGTALGVWRWRGA